MGAFLGLCEIETDLKLEPHFRISIEGEGKPQRHFCRYTAMAVDEIVQRLPRNAEHARALGDGKLVPFQTLMANNLAGMNGSD
jgi:hypothetical protein